ncbi:hypothetical protein WDZ16_11390 [Pseudokineococcus marinus]|uniref:Uncharacterized protein n=1 Tax=Pseudokineococcus marinus TaxID=351215 RepID=A0A849BNQ9_9ACTN|nr:hypothetical protein [Pseudokineococcus marinus]NNH22973.1 hypothetical protein [Pseudokineococcus marinus]
MHDDADDQPTTADDGRPQDAGTRSRGPAIPTISVNAAEQDPDPSESSSDSTAQHDSADYDNDREDLPPGPSSSA